MFIPGGAVRKTSARPPSICSVIDLQTGPQQEGNIPSPLQESHCWVLTIYSEEKRKVDNQILVYYNNVLLNSMY